jgi:DNA-binding NarL/FixJ family response regulator
MKKKLHILIVDDNPRARSALSAFLSTMDGVIVSGEASNGGEALIQIEQRLPDIVLMDIQMPVMDGLQATRLIKIRWRQVRVIALTMYANYEAQAKEAGADAVLIKGCPAEEMKTTIRSLASKTPGLSSAMNTFVLYLERNNRI